MRKRIAHEMHDAIVKDLTVGTVYRLVRCVHLQIVNPCIVLLPV